MACRFLNISGFCGLNRPGPEICRAPVKKGAAAVLMAFLGGCSISFPMEPLFVPGAKEDFSGKTASQPFAKLLDAGDWGRAKSALAAALDPDADGSPALWDNPGSGNKGSFAPIGEAYLLDTKTCRVFLAKVDRKDGAQTLKGTACAEKPGEWSITG